MTHEVEVRVRYGETDQMGVVYHGAYVPYLEIGRTELLRALGFPYAALEARGFGLVIVEITMKLSGAAVYDDRLVVRTWVTGVSHAQVGFAYEIAHADGRRLVTAATTLACLDRTTRRVRRLPADVRARLHEALEAGHAPAPADAARTRTTRV